MGARPRGDLDVGGGWQGVWVAAKRPRKSVSQMLCLDFPRPAGTVELKRLWEAEVLGKGLQPLGNSRVPHAGRLLWIGPEEAMVGLGGGRRRGVQSLLRFGFWSTSL